MQVGTWASLYRQYLQVKKTVVFSSVCNCVTIGFLLISVVTRRISRDEVKQR